MPVQLLSDLHISPKTVAALRGIGYPISRVTDYLPTIASDQEIIHLAEDLRASIPTQDLDFSALIAQSGKSFPSLLSLRLGNVSHQRVTDLLQVLLPTIENELKQGSIISSMRKQSEFVPFPSNKQLTYVVKTGSTPKGPPPPRRGEASR